MAAKSVVSLEISRRRARLYRYLNDTWIYTETLSPLLGAQSAEMRHSKRKLKKAYRTPRRGEWLRSFRRDSDIGDLFRAQRDRGVYEANLVNIVSRVEAFIQECLTIAILVFPEKVKILGDSGGIPFDMFLANEEREVLLRRYVEMRCQGLMFGKPADYLAKAAKVLSISISPTNVGAYVEFKASRDIVVHGSGTINRIYLDKVGEKLARGALGEELTIDRDYLADVVAAAKALSGQIEDAALKVFK